MRTNHTVSLEGSNSDQHKLPRSACYICSVPGKGSFVCSNDEAEALNRAELLGKFDELVTELGYIGVTRQMLSQRLKGEQNND